MKDIDTYIQEGFYSNVKSNPLQALESFWNSPERAEVRKHSGIKRLQDTKKLENILDNIFSIENIRELTFEDKSNLITFRIIKGSPDFVYKIEKAGLHTKIAYVHTTFGLSTKMFNHYWNSNRDIVFDNFKISI